MPLLRKLRGLLLISAIVLGFAGLGVAGAWYVNRNGQNKQDSAPTRLERSEADIASDKALGMAASGKPEEAVKDLDKSIATADDAPQKAQMLSAKSTVYLNDGDTDNALRFAKEAFDTNPTAGIASLVAQIYEKMGDKANAASYYKKAVDALDRNNPLYDEDKQFYEAKAIELERA